MRPKKTRWVSCKPEERYFRPKGIPLKGMEGVVLTLDEFEAVRLIDLENWEQFDVAKRMNVHRSTVSRILTTGRNKIADALTNLKAIKIEGGCCQIIRKNDIRKLNSGKTVKKNDGQ
jgi:uncharacterized protein